MRQGLIVLLASVVAACASTPPADTYYSLVLEAADEGAVEPNDDAVSQVVLSMVGLPAFLDSRAMVLQVGPNEVQSAQHHFWAERLDEAIAKVLVRDIMNASDTIFLPNTSQSDGACELRLQFDRFHATDDARVLVSGRYWLRSVNGNASREFDVSQILGTSGYASVVSALRHSLGSLGRELGSQIASNEGCRKPEPAPNPDPGSE